MTTRPGPRPVLKTESVTAETSLGVVLVHYRARWQATASLQALLSGTRRPDHVLVVDNASADGSVVALRGQFPHIEFVEAGSNRGAAAAMNLGTASLLALGVLEILLLTADCVLAPTALEELEARLTSEPEVGAVGPLLAFASAPEKVFSAGGYLDRGTWDPRHHRDPPHLDDWKGMPPQAREWLDGACLLVRVEALQATGPFDEEYFHYFDDVDHHMRMRACGWRVECVPSAVAWQEPGDLAPDLWVRNRLRFLMRHAPRHVLARELARQVRSEIRELRVGDRQRAAARRRGLALFLSGRWGPCRRIGLSRSSTRRSLND